MVKRKRHPRKKKPPKSPENKEENRKNTGGAFLKVIISE
jgi:hypothetical protein